MYHSQPNNLMLDDYLRENSIISPIISLAMVSK